MTADDRRQRRSLLPVRQRVFRKSGRPFAIGYAGLTSLCMAQPVSTEQPIPGLPLRRLGSAVAASGVALGVIILLAALVLWLHYGTAVFFEMIASGIAACF
jgi:hypothetical protein